MTGKSVTRAVARREVRSFFASPVAWLFLGAFAAVSLFVFFWVESFFARNIADIRPLFEWMPLLLVFLCAALTMRMWSDERRTGTLEHVLTQPASLWRFVFGKFCACFALLLLALVSTLPLPATVGLISELDWGPVLGGYLAACLLGAAYISVGLFVSARTDNAIVSLIGTVALCSVLFLVGSPILTEFFHDDTANLMRLLGTGSRFESITRGVIDARDLCYYLSLTAGFLALNVYSLESERWARSVHTPRHRHWRTATLLVICNLVVANIWLARFDALRLDLTRGKLYSISAPTLDFLARLQEPLLIRGYFSDRSHPLLAPLVPQLQDLLKEYEIAGGGRVRVEFINPAEEPELEQEANEKYGITAAPFKVADRHQATLINAYFNILVRYGDEYETLGFNDLVEVRTLANTPPEVVLRNPEYDITRAIKDVLYRYQLGGNLFASIDEPVEFIAYVSADDLLPETLLAYRENIEPVLRGLEKSSGGRFSLRFIDPAAGDGAVARQIMDEWGFRPMVTALDPEREFFFYLTLADKRQVVQLPTDDFDPAGFPAVLEAGLRRFASGFTRMVALAVPRVNEQMARYKLGGPTFGELEDLITRDYSIQLENLADGSVSPEADILAVVAPHQLSEASVLAIDQFLMRGGTVILATSPFTAEISGGQLRMQDWDSGLASWLAHMGIKIDKQLVLDKLHAAFPAPVTRQAGDYEFRDVRMIDYPYFLDLRPPGLNAEHPITAGLPQLTMAWASPVTVERESGRRITPLLETSPDAWLSDDRDVMPRVDASGLASFEPPTPGAGDEGVVRGRRQVGLLLQGRFPSYFADRALPRGEIDSDSPELPHPASLLRHSPASARIVLFASNDFMDDQILNAQVAATGTRYLGPLELFMNTLDWSLRDDQLLEIRSQAHFNRSLPPMERRAQALIEYFNYGMALTWLGLLALLHQFATWIRRRRLRRALAL
jgi:ABC-2 type transport system permease protein